MDYVHIESGGSVRSTAATYRGETIPAESITWTVDARGGVASAVITVPAVLLMADLSPDLVEFIVSHEQDPHTEETP